MTIFLGTVHDQSELPRLLVLPFPFDGFRAWIVGRFDRLAVGHGPAQQVGV